MAVPTPRSIPELPIEVIQQIFAVFAAPLSFTTLTFTPFPWFLGHICSTWRCLFLSMTAEFWSAIAISYRLKEHKPEKYERTLNAVRFFLERDPAAPFSFKVTSPYCLSEYNPQAVDYARRMVEMLAHHSMRWRTASFALDAQALLPLIHAKNRLPLLRVLELSFLRDAKENIPNQLYDVFQNAPSLNVVRINNLADFEFDLSNLKAVQVFKLESGASKFIRTLLQMIKLEQLQLGYSSAPVIRPGTIDLPNLTKLECKPDWLHILKTPALEDLFLYYEGDEDDFNIPLSFLRRSSKIVRLGIASARGSTVVEIIRHTPQITQLELVDITNVGIVFEQLTISTNPAQEPLACHMLSLLFHDDDDSHDSDMVLLSDLISSRAARSATADYERLRELKVTGRLSCVSSAAQKDVIALCKERDVQYIEESVFHFLGMTS